MRDMLEGYKMKEDAQEFAEHVFFVPDRLCKSLGLWPVRLGRNRTKPRYSAGPRTIDYFSLHLIQSGSVTVQYGEQTYELIKGDLFCLWPGKLFSYRPTEPRIAAEMTWIAFAGSQALILLQLIGISEDKPFLKGKLSTGSDMIIQQMWKASGQQKHTQLTVLSLLYQLFERLHSDMLTRSSANNRHRHWVRQSLEYMDTHYSENISISQIAAEMGVHRTYFSKVFTEEVGVTPLQYLRKLKMDKAKRLLMESSLTVAEIALSLSYSDTASFTRSFAAFFGYPPSSFRGKAKL
jgi:AraC-like DNA-binding protein